MSVLVSVNCTTYNHEDYIADAIEGFLMQETDFEYEILIHDDASTDRTAEIIRKYEEKYPDLIKPIYQTENQLSRDDISRMSYTFNTKRAKGKYIAMCEGDDYWTDPNKLQKQVDYMEEHPGCSMTFHAAEWVYEDDSSLNKTRRTFKENYKVNADEAIIAGGHMYPTASAVYRKKFVESPPDFYFNAPTGDDALILVLLQYGYFYYINEVMAVHRKNVPGSWNDRVFNVKEKYISFYKEKNNMLEEFNIYTNYIYQDAVKKRKMINNRALFSKVNTVEDINIFQLKRKLSELPTKYKLMVYLKIYFPLFYKFFKKIKGYL